MTEIKYIIGDLFAVIEGKENHIIIPHVCNTIGAWGAGFVVPLGKYFPKARERYIEWAERKDKGIPLQLGLSQNVFINQKLTVVNMIGQLDTGLGINGRPPIRYWALAKCLRDVAGLAQALDAEIHAPKFGAGLAGGNWTFIETLINECWCYLDIPVTIYSLEEAPKIDTTEDVGD